MSLFFYLFTFAIILWHCVSKKFSKKFPKVFLPVDRSPNRITCLIPGPVRPMMLNGIVSDLPCFHNALDRQTDRPTHVRTDRQTDRSSTGKFDDYRPLRYESDAA